MPLYVFHFVDEDGFEHTVEKVFSMSEMPDAIEVTVGDARYVAHRIPIVRTARMKNNWAKGTPVSDLPPENWTGE